MKQTKAKLLCLLLAVLMLLSSLTACGKDKAKDSNLIKLGDYELLYKGACIMEDSDGNDAIVLTLDFTNNGKENASYLWSVDETVMQNGVELEAATVFTDYDTFETVIEGQFADVAPGQRWKSGQHICFRTRPIQSRQPSSSSSARKTARSPSTHPH